MKEFFNKLSKEIAKRIAQNKQSCQKLAFKHHHADGAVCAPSNHQVLFEDNNIRVINVTLKAYEDEIFHRHERAAIMYVDMPTRIQYFENAEESAWSSDNLEPRFATIPFEAMHKVKNLDGTCYRAFRIEICHDVMALANHDEVLKQISDFIQTQKQQFDVIRHTLLSSKNHEEVNFAQVSTVLAPLQKAKQKRGLIRNSEAIELLAEANSFKRRFYGVIN